MNGKRNSIHSFSFLRLVRRQLRRWQAQLRWRQASFGSAPILFANSFPKSGTHLLTQVLQGFPGIGLSADSGLPAIVTYQGESGQARPTSKILSDLERLLPGDISYGHLHARVEIRNWFNHPGRVCYFILRDPRDVVVSHVHYVTEMNPKHVHHHYYTNQLNTFDERLRTSITGIPNGPVPFPDIATRFEPYLGWMDHSGSDETNPVANIRFEDFIQDRQEVLVSLLEHAIRNGFSLRVNRQAALDHLEASINPQRSPTFRTGKAGGWKERFSPDNKELFKSIAGDLLIKLGYETDNRW